MREPLDTYIDDLEEMAPVISYRETDLGWRGITSQGEVLEVSGSNGHKITPPPEILVSHRGVPIGRRQVRNDSDVDIDRYLHHFNLAVECYKNGSLDKAIQHCEFANEICPTLRSRFNRAMILLASGNWRRGMAEYWACEQEKPFMRPQVEQALSMGLRPWRGEPLTGKRLLLLHAHGYGDTIMCLRYVSALKRTVMVVPHELASLAEQHGLVVDRPIDCDFFAPMLHLLYMLNVTPEYNVRPGYYLRAHRDRLLNEKWQNRLGSERKRRIGLSWSVGKPSTGDYPREIDLESLVSRLPKDAELHSVQTQNAEVADRCGVHPHDFSSFQDCAALMWCLDEIVSVDTAALHLAGAIGHPRVTGLLSHWHSWRWLAPWYPNVRLIRQTSANDWSSALGQL